MPLRQADVIEHVLKKSAAGCKMDVTDPFCFPSVEVGGI
jgi:hypothetical protein